MYPHHPRFLLFLVPFCIFCCSCAFDAVFRRFDGLLARLPFYDICAAPHGARSFVLLCGTDHSSSSVPGNNFDKHKTDGDNGCTRSQVAGSRSYPQFQSLLSVGTTDIFNLLLEGYPRFRRWFHSLTGRPLQRPEVTASGLFSIGHAQSPALPSYQKNRSDNTAFFDQVGLS